MKFSIVAAVDESIFLSVRTGQKRLDASGTKDIVIGISMSKLRLIVANLIDRSLLVSLLEHYFTPE